MCLSEDVGLVYSTFIGGSKSDFGDGFALDGAGNAYGSVWLAGASGPGGATTADAFDPFFNGAPADAYVARLNAFGSAFEFASFLGGSESEVGGDVALDGAGNVYLTGHTYSPDFTTTAGAFDRTWADDPLIWSDAFIAKIDVGATAPAGPVAGTCARLVRRERRELLHDPGRQQPARTTHVVEGARGQRHLVGLPALRGVQLMAHPSGQPPSAARTASPVIQPKRLL